VVWSLPLALGSVLVTLWTGGWVRSRTGAQGPVRAGTIQSVLHLENFVMNLEDSGGRAYLRIGIDVGMNHPLQEAERAGPTSPIAPLRDTIIGVLGSCHADQLLTPEGKGRLKRDLLKALQERAPELGIEEVYFTELLIQR